MGEMRAVLIVDDDPQFARGIGRSIKVRAQPVIALGVAEALHEIQSRDRLWAAVIDAVLPDGSGFDVLTTLREKHPFVPVLLATGYSDREKINLAQLHGAHFASKPLEPAAIESFIDWVEAYYAQPKRTLGVLIDNLGDEHGLSPRERELLLLAATGHPTADLADPMGVSVNTVKTLTKRILRKCDVNSLAEIVQPLQVKVFGGGDSGGA